MSTASQSITVTRLRNGVSYASSLVTNKGDLYQQYNTTTVVPDFTVADKQPVVTFVNAVTGTNDAIPPTINIYWDGVKVPFASLAEGTGNDTGAGLAAGTIVIFQKGDAAQNKQWKFKFTKNIVVPSATPLVSHLLKVEGIFPSGKTVATKPFNLIPLTESGYDVHIESGGNDDTPFTVNQAINGSQCSLVAVVTKGGTEVKATGNMTFRWFIKDATQNTGWRQLTESTDTLIVTANDVYAYSEYKVEVTIDGEVYSDTQSVTDLGDPYYISLQVTDQNGDPATPEMNGEVASNEERVFKASLASRNGGNVPPIKTCYWTVMSVDGVIQNNFSANTSQGVAKNSYHTTEFHLPAAWIDSLNGGAGLQSVDVTVQITF